MLTPRLWPSAKALLALSALAICVSGCATVNVGTSKRGVMLPEVPAFVAPVTRPAVKVGDDARLAWRKTSAALGQANGRLVQTREWYIGVRSRYSAAKLK